MKKLSYLLALLALPGAFLAGYYFSQRPGMRADGPAGPPILYYVDPMDPSHISDKPGRAPCGMNFEPVYADAEPGQDAAAGRKSAVPAGSVGLSPARQQLIGVQTLTAEVAEQTLALRTLGRVAAQEDRISRILAAREGYMEDIRGALPSGTLVKKDQVLASYYNVDSLPTQQAYVYALNAVDQKQQDEVFAGQLGASRDPQLRQAEDSLKYYGVEGAQIREIARSRQVSSFIELRSPIAGFIVARNLFPYSRFEQGAELFRIADLSRVWIYADIYENEEKYIKPGTEAQVRLPGRDEVFSARVSDSLPRFDEKTRTYKVRLETANPRFLLKPDAFVDVELMIAMPPALTVPQEAVLDSGLKKTVYVELGNGIFEPRQVATGWSAGSRIEIKQGLMAGERVVIAGSFLLDSESRMRLAAAGVHEPGPAAGRENGLEIDPVCGMQVVRERARTAGNISERDGRTYYFCRGRCKQQFDSRQQHD